MLRLRIAAVVDKAERQSPLQLYKDATEKTHAWTDSALPRLAWVVKAKRKDLTDFHQPRRCNLAPGPPATEVDPSRGTYLKKEGEGEVKETRTSCLWQRWGAQRFCGTGPLLR